MKLRARWAGPPPRVGDYLASPTRPRFAYHIRSVHPVDPIVRWDPAQKTELHRLAIEVDRIPIADLPTSARIYAWSWDKRTAKKGLSR